MSPAIRPIVSALLQQAPGLDNHRTALWMVDEVNDLIRPDFVQFIGDNVQDASDEQFRLFGDLTSRLSVPWFALVGSFTVFVVGLAASFMLPGQPVAAPTKEPVR